MRRAEYGRITDGLLFEKFANDLRLSLAAVKATAHTRLEAVARHAGQTRLLRVRFDKLFGRNPAARGMVRKFAVNRHKVQTPVIGDGIDPIAAEALAGHSRRNRHIDTLGADPRGLDMPIVQPPPEAMICRSDRGCQYTNYPFGKRCQKVRVMPSVGSVGNACEVAYTVGPRPRLRCSSGSKAGTTAPAATLDCLPISG